MNSAAKKAKRTGVGIRRHKAFAAFPGDVHHALDRINTIYIIHPYLNVF